MFDPTSNRKYLLPNCHSNQKYLLPPSGRHPDGDLESAQVSMVTMQRVTVYNSDGRIHAGQRARARGVRNVYQGW
jgi:hypothetical protein